MAIIDISRYPRKVITASALFGAEKSEEPQLADDARILLCKVRSINRLFFCIRKYYYRILHFFF